MTIRLRRRIRCPRCRGTTQATLLQEGLVSDLQKSAQQQSDPTPLPPELLEHPDDLDEEDPEEPLEVGPGPQGWVDCDQLDLWGRVGCGWSRWVWERECEVVP